MSITRNLLNIIIIICVCLNCWRCTEGTEKRKIDSHTIQVSSLFPLPSSPCVLSPKASKSSSSSSLHVVNKHGPCSHISNVKAAGPNHTDILRHDKARVDSIHSKLSKNFTDRITTSQSRDLPAKDGSTVGSGNYIVTIGIGTPKHDLSLIFDTGSDLTWIQCKPCAGSCYPQKEPIFDPSSSSSYSNISCSSPVCEALPSEGLVRRCSESSCIYGTQYGDGSFTLGFLAKEKFTLSSSDVFDDVNFGCGQDNEGLFTGAAGLLGLGRNKLSFPSQTATTYNNIFSYCLPSSSNYTGHLTFGSTGISNSAKFTPISSTAGPSFYGLDIVGITVGDQKLEILSTVFTTPGAIIDSGTVITRLPPKAYAALRSAFKAGMSNYTTTTRASSVMDTCYDFTGLDTVEIPKVTFSFSGDVVVEIDAKGLLYVFKISQVCLAFAGNDNDDDVAIFGNVQQQTLEVVYDEAGGRIGFAQNGCS